MKINFFSYILVALLLLTGCGQKNTENTITFAVSAEYPPFEYYANDKITGFDIDLASLIAKELGMQAKFENMQFNAILAAINNGLVDAGISTMTITKERQKNFDFSLPYYTESLATLFLAKSPITTPAQLSGKKAACQLGSSMELWLKQHAPTANMILMDDNNHEVEALKAGHVDVVILDSMQAAIFSKKNVGLAYATIATADAGYAIAFKKGSALKEKVNKALDSLAAQGKIKQLQQKWLENDT